jgi:hypothetical protein
MSRPDLLNSSYFDPCAVLEEVAILAITNRLERQGNGRTAVKATKDRGAEESDDVDNDVSPPMFVDYDWDKVEFG